MGARAPLHDSQMVAVSPRPRALVLVAALTLAGTGGCRGNARPGDDPLDDEGWQANISEGERRSMAACPNGGKDVPPAPSFAAAIDAYTSYDGQTNCDPTAKPGVVAFKDLVLATYPCTTNGGISRDCSVGGMSEHKEGRAWDWMATYPHPAVTTLHGWLLATDSHGNAHAMLRRFGIMYMIWNSQIWKAYQPTKGWQAYTGSNPHTDHVHFSFSWDGANKQTTFWTSGQPPKPDARPPDQGTRDRPTRDGTVDRRASSEPGVHVDAEWSNIPEDPLPPNEGVEVRGGCAVVGHEPVDRAAVLLLGLPLLALVVRRGRLPVR